MRLLQKELLLYNNKFDGWRTGNLNFTSTSANICCNVMSFYNGTPRFIVAKDMGETFSSTDCQTWTKYSQESDNVPFSAMCHSKGLNLSNVIMLAVSKNGAIYQFHFDNNTNPDTSFSVTWEKIFSFSGYTFNDVNIGSYKAMAIGGRYLGGTDITVTFCLYTTSDITKALTPNTDWSAETPIPSDTHSPNSLIKYGTNISPYNVLTYANQIIQASDETFYNPFDIPSMKANCFFECNSNTFLICGENGAIGKASKSGANITFTYLTNKGNYNWIDTAGVYSANGTKRVAVISDNGYVTETSDGTNWTIPVNLGIGNNDTSNKYAITYANNKFLAVCSNGEYAYKDYTNL